MKVEPFRIKAVFFDFDGTLTRPGTIDFEAIKQEIGCPGSIPILEYIESLSDSKMRSQAREALEGFEMAAAAVSQPNPGAESIVSYIREQGLPVAILSRNSLASIKRAFQNFSYLQESHFDYIGSRDVPVKPKPKPDGILLGAKRLGVDPREVMIVGDYVFDIQAGRAAGALTVYLENGYGGQGMDIESHFSISNLAELKTIIRMGLPLQAGKLPNDLLALFMEEIIQHDPSVLLGPRVGEDVAVVAVDDVDVLILKSDPITFVTDAVDQYAVLVNANDIATSGAVPRWFLTTLLFPCGTTPSEIGHVIQSIHAMCNQWGISLCGGHTEITDAVTRPVVTGMMVGIVDRDGLIDKREMALGDKVLLTKKVAVEGTAIIAREFEEKLISAGMYQEEIEEAKGFLSKIGVLEEARIAREASGIHAMHDVTEGGLATALDELSKAGNHRIMVNIDAIPIYPQTEKICNLMGLNPLGLIGSGSLLICCAAEGVDSLIEKIREADIPVSCIGEVTEPGEGLKAVRGGRPAEWPEFERDELARLHE